MKNRISAVLVGLAMILASSSASHAMSRLASLSMKPLWPTSTTPGNVVLYEITVTREGQGMLEVELSSDGMPEGASVSFSVNPVRFVGREPKTVKCIMTVTCTEPTPVDNYAFTVTGKSRRETITIANEVTKALPDAGPSLRLELHPDDSAWLFGRGLSGQTYRVDTTTDLWIGSWDMLGITTADGNGRFILIEEDSQAAELPMKFYRAVPLALEGAEALAE